MTPIATAEAPVASASSSKKLDPSLFPDGLKTSGQHPPIYSLLSPFEDFPSRIEGPTVWNAETLKQRTDEWVYAFNPSQIDELSVAADQFLASGVPLTGISRELFPLPILGPLFDSLKPTLLNGRGFILFKNIPVNDWTKEKCAAAYLGLGTYFGYFISQNGRGHILGHVKNLSENQADSKVPIRIYRTNKRQFFHTDSCDIVGLLCMARAQSGGESDIASTHEIWNTLQQEDPDALRTMCEPIWYFDRKGEVSEGEEPYLRTPLFMLEPNSSTPRLYAKFDPMNVTTLARFNSGPNPEIPPLSPKQLHAIDVLERTANRLALHMILEPGDIQLLTNSHIFHARTEYTDWPAGSVDEAGLPRKQRQLMRLWLATPDGEGGWKLPFLDSGSKKRGGVQVNDTPPQCPLEAE